MHEINDLISEKDTVGGRQSKNPCLTTRAPFTGSNWAAASRQTSWGSRRGRAAASAGTPWGTSTCGSWTASSRTSPRNQVSEHITSFHLWKACAYLFVNEGLDSICGITGTRNDLEDSLMTLSCLLRRRRLQHGHSVRGQQRWPGGQLWEHRDAPGGPGDSDLGRGWGHAALIQRPPQRRGGHQLLPSLLPGIILTGKCL